MQDLLRGFQLDKRSLILHSLRPEETPHIVITPPPVPEYNELDGHWENRPCIQWIGPLSVPPLPWHVPYYAPPPFEGHPGGWCYGGGYVLPPSYLNTECTPHNAQTQPSKISPTELKRLVSYVCIHAGYHVERRPRYHWPRRSTLHAIRRYCPFIGVNTKLR